MSAPPREQFDLSNLGFGVGAIGRLQVLNTIPVVAGDSMSLDMSGIVRLTPFRRQLITDAKIDILTCFVPYRHIYGQDWLDYIAAGQDETIDLATVDAGNGNNWNDFEANPWSTTGDVPMWMIQGYCNIWNRFFRPPKQSIAERDYTFNPTGDDIYGFLCATMPAIWNTGHDSGAYPTNNSVASTTSFTVTDLARQAAEWDSELQREWKDTYYRDFMKNIWGGGASVDADERPTVLGHSSQWMSGFDVYGTATGNLAEASGRTEAAVTHGFPRRLFKEHGTIWTVAVVRFPPTHEDEKHWLIGNPNPTYVELTADPTLMSKQEPYDLKLNDVFKTSSTTSLGKIPFGQWYRTQPNMVHHRYESTEGYAFMDTIPSSLQDAVLYPSRRYTSGFAKTTMLHYQSSIRNNVKALRVVPSSGSSVFAGADL